jgi:hypothetical protein
MTAGTGNDEEQEQATARAVVLRERRKQVESGRNV